jgi:hypothetical protein
MLWGTLGRLGVFVTTLAASGWVAGCSGDDEQPFDCTVMPACDVARADCQQRVFSATACARGQPGASMPAIRAITAQTFADELRAQAGADPNAEVGPWEKALRLLRLAPSEAPLIDQLIDNYVSNIVAYYDPETKRVSLITDSESDPENARFVLSHEFVHALQDQDVDLIAFQRQATSTDDSVALDALIEGEALLHPNLLIARALKVAPELIRWDDYTSDILSSTFQSIDAADAPYFDAMQLLPYPVGLRFLIGPWLESGQSAIDALYEAPLLSFGQWTFSPGPDQLRSADRLTCFPTSGPAGYSAYDHDRLGITALIGLLVTLRELASFAFDVSSTLSDDRLVVFRAPDPAQGVAVAWRLRFSSEAAASSFADTINRDATGHFDHLLVEPLEQREVLIRGADDESLNAAWPNGAACGRAEDLPVRPPSEAPSALARRLPPWRGLTAPLRDVRTTASARTSRSR